MSVFNGAHALAASIESILEQKDVEFEFIIVDDGSTDESGSILEQYARADPRIRVIRQKNQGLTKALIRGCVEARGQFIARQDVGDISCPGRLAKQLALIKSDPSVVLVSCGTRFVGPQGEDLYDLIQSDREAMEGLRARDMDTLRGPSCHGSAMFRASAYRHVGGYRHQFRMGQDVDLWVRLAENGVPRVVQEILYMYEHSLGGISAGRHQDQLWISRMILRCAEARRKGEREDDLLREVQTYSELARRRRGTKGAAAYYIGSLLQDKDAQGARKYLILALKENPMQLKAWLRLFRTFTALAK